MTEKYALKRLTASDLTLFEWHFKERNAGNQKAINLNRNPFIDILYPALPAIAEKKDWKIQIDLKIYGPGKAGELNLSRKLIKGRTYKNWRLDGEFIVDPIDEQGRFTTLEPGDIVIMVFEGDPEPEIMKTYFVTRSIAVDRPIYHVLDRFMKKKKMMASSQEELIDTLKGVEIPEDHPLFTLLISDDLTDASLGGAIGIQKLLRIPSLKKLSQEELRKQRMKAEKIGYEGERFVDEFLSQLMDEGDIYDYDWVSQSNAIAPYDFTMVSNNKAEQFIEVKSTRSSFEKPFHISYNEILAAMDSDNYQIYRVFNIDDNKAELKICKEPQRIAKKIVDCSNELGGSIKPNSFSIFPEILEFGRAITIDISDDEEEDYD